MTAPPRVSVLMPVRDGLPWLPSALDTVLAQTFTDFELIVLEDGSTDATPDVLASVTDPRVRVIPTGGVGIARALNAGLAVARGVYVARHDADDESEPARLERQVEVLDAQPDVDVVSTVAEYIDTGGQVVVNDWVDIVRRQQDAALTHEAIRELMPLTCCVTHGAVLLRRQVLLDAGGYRADMVPAEDYDLWLRLLPRHRFVKLPDRLYRHRLHAGQTGFRARDEQTRKAVLAKLNYVRRVCPRIPDQAALAIVGSTRGDAHYRDAAPLAGFRPVEWPSDWDVLAVTDFATIDAQYRELTREGCIELIGNCFVAVPYASSRG